MDQGSGRRCGSQRQRKRRQARIARRLDSLHRLQRHGKVSGSQITVALSGYDIHLEASGTGRFVLRGNGSYSVEKDGQMVVTGAWTEETEVLSIP
ncbi:MAG: hypothetical protein Fur0043_28500 [Anaerolineales bacterium]